MYRLRSALLPFLLPALVACGAGVEVKPLKPGQSPPPTGIPWNLGMTQFTITVTRHLKQCVSGLKGTVDVAVVPRNVVDPDQRYIIDAPGWTSTSNLTANFGPNGLSTGMASDVVDATPEILAAVVKAAALIGTVAAFRIEENGSIHQPPAPSAKCKDAVAEKVLVLYPTDGTDGLEKQVNDAVTVFNNATAKLTLLTALKNEDPPSRQALLQALTDQQKAAKNVDDLKLELTQALQVTTDVQTAVWPRVSRGKGWTKVTNSKALKEAWADPKSPRGWDGFLETLDVQAGLYRFNPKSGDPELLPDRSTPEGTETGDTDSSSSGDASLDGLPIRVAQMGLLVTCAGPSCNVTSKPDDLLVENTVKVFEQPVLQMGDVSYVRMRGGSFKSESAVVKLDDNGNPTSIQVMEKAAAAAGAAASAQDALTQLSGIRSTLEANKLAQTNAKTAQYEANTKLATAKATAQLSEQTGQATATAALINANVAEQKAQNDLDALNAAKAGSE